MEIQEIDVFIDPDGRVRLEVRGVKGPACLAATQELETALGGEVIAREMTPEVNEAASQTSQDWQRQRSR